ncbi:MAG: hypothetical protein ACC628_11890, partial [Pirellulaceae bacterium]
MNWQHMRTILWLRWRSRLNQLKRAGSLNAVLTILLLGVAVVTGVSMFFVALLVGLFVLPEASPDVILFLWDGLIVAFLFFWLTGLVTELQRSDVLSFEKLLHLPISLAGTFLFNYVSSLFSVSLVLFVPAMVGLSIALVIAKGPAMLIVLPLVISFVLMVTAITYQLRGWLATLMINKRRRRTIIALLTAGFILLAQAPNLFNLMFQRSRRDVSRVEARQREKEMNELTHAFKSGEMEAAQYQSQTEALFNIAARKRTEARQARFDKIILVAGVANVCLPPGWLAYGAMAATRNNIWPGLLGALGASLIGLGSLCRSYRTTLRFYLGEHQTGGVKRKKTAAIVKPPVEKARSNFLEKKLAWFSDPSTVIALANFRSLMRAPEVKIVLISPIIIFTILGSMLYSTRGLSSNLALRAPMATGAVMMLMFSLIQLFQNHFGYDRDGFRVYLLSPASRRDILLGKNLSLAPIVLSIGAIVLAVLHIVAPLPITHLVAAFVQLVAAFLVVCMVGNLMSVFLPTAVA